MEPTPPVQCVTCLRRAECEKRECPCPELEAWLDETYRAHDSIALETNIEGLPVVEWRI